MPRSIRVAAVVLARARSSRLPGKMLLPFGRGTVLSTAIERIGACRTVDEVVLATGDAAADDPLARVGHALGIRVVRGSEEDVVARMAQAVRACAALPDAVVRGCADNPLAMPPVIDAAVGELAESGSDLVTPFERQTYPFGFGLAVLARECLERIDREARHPLYREHVENYCLERPGDFRIRCQTAPPELAYPELGLTLDHPVDYARLRRCAALLEGVPLERQPGELLERIRRTRVWIEGASEGPAEGSDLIVRERDRPGQRAPLGVVVTGRFAVGGPPRFGLRYAPGRDAALPTGPIYLDDRADPAPHAGAFLEHVAEAALPLLRTSPVRPAALQESRRLPEEKRVRRREGAGR